MKHLNLLLSCFGLFVFLSADLCRAQLQLPPGRGVRSDSLTAATVITDNGGPANPYQSESASAVTLLPRTGNVVTLSFTQFDLEAGNDFVYVFDGPNTSYPMLLCGTTGNTLPPNVVGTNPLGMTILLISDGDVERAGFSATATPGPGGTPPDTTKRSIPYFGQIKMKGCSGEVYDPGGRTCNYPIGAGIVDSDGHIVIEPDSPDKVIRINFSVFNVEPVPGGFSPADYLRVHDGPDTLSPVIGEYAANPGPVTADAGNVSNPSGALTLRFVSDFLFNFEGFVGAISCVDRTAADILTPDTTICFRDTAKVRVRFTKGTAPYSLVYQTPAGRTTLTNITGNSVVIAVPNLQVGNSSFVIRQLGDANLSLRDVSGPQYTRIITVKAPPTAAFAQAVSEICNGNPANLSVNLTGTPPFTLTYQAGTGPPVTVNNIAASPFVITFNPNATTLVRINSFRDATCPGQITGGAAVVTVTPRPEVTFGTGSAGNVCPGASKALTLNFVGKGPYTVTYSDGTANFTINNIVSNPHVFLVTVNRPTTFTLVSVTTPNCPPGIANGSAVVGLHTPPALEVTPSVDCATGMGRLTAVATGGRPSYSYSFDGGRTFGIDNFALRPITDVPYSVVAMDANGCRDTVSVLMNGLAAPVITGFDNITASSLRITWQANPSPGARYTLRYRVKGSEGSWITVPNLTSNVRNLVGLQAGTEYEFQVSVNCAGGLTSPWSELRFERTLNAVAPNCVGNIFPVPTNFFVSQITATSARLTWNSVTGPGYIFSHGVASQNPNGWRQQVQCNSTPFSPTTSVLLTNLSPNTVYRARVRTNCSNCTTAFKFDDNRSNWSTVIEWRSLANREENVFTQTEENISLYPNPNKGSFFLSGDFSAGGTVTVYDLTGKTVLHRTVAPSELTELSVELPYETTEGIYLVTVEQTGLLRRFKMIKDR